MGHTDAEPVRRLVTSPDERRKRSEALRTRLENTSLAQFTGKDLGPVMRVLGLVQYQSFGGLTQAPTDEDLDLIEGKLGGSTHA